MWKTKLLFPSCDRPMCDEHRAYLCTDCAGHEWFLAVWYILYFFSHYNTTTKYFSNLKDF